MLGRRRPLARAAAVGGVAYVAGKAGARSAADDADQSPPPDAPEAQEQAPAEEPVAAAPSADDSMKKLTQLKGLLDSGVLTQAEFDEQKQKILQTM